MNKKEVLDRVSKFLDLYDEKFYSFNNSWYIHQERIDIIAINKGVVIMNELLKVDKKRYREEMCKNCGDKVGMDCTVSDDDIESCFEASLPLE